MKLVLSQRTRQRSEALIGVIGVIGVIGGHNRDLAVSNFRQAGAT